MIALNIVEIGRHRRYNRVNISLNRDWQYERAEEICVLVVLLISKSIDSYHSRVVVC